MGKGAVLSGLLHLAVVLLAVFGLPWLYNTNEVIEATPVTTISAAQFAQLQSKKPPAQKKQEELKEQEIPPAPPAPDVAKPEPEPEEPAPPEPAPAVEPAPPPPPEPPQQQAEQLPQPPPPAVQPEPPQPEQQVIAPEPPPQPKPEPVPAPEPQVAEAQPKPVPPKKPPPPKKKEEPKKKEQPKQEQVAADDTSFLKDIEKKLKKNQKKSQPQPQPQQAALPPDNYDGPPLSEGEKDLIKQQIEDHTSVDPGMQGLEGFIVEVKVIMNPDGSVQSAKIDYSKSNPHPNWRIFAEACERAVGKSSPLRMPPEKPYAAWKEMTLVFHGKEMARL
jgi:hypothetical protein